MVICLAQVTFAEEASAQSVVIIDETTLVYWYEDKIYTRELNAGQIIDISITVDQHPIDVLNALPVVLYVEDSRGQTVFDSDDMFEGRVYQFSFVVASSDTYKFVITNYGEDTATVQIKVTATNSSSPASTTLTISPTSFSVQAGQTINLTATLTSGGNPLADKLVSWSATAGSLSSTSGTTNALGQVSVTYTAPSVATQISLMVTITASFVGDENYMASQENSIGTIMVPLPPTTKENLSLEVIGGGMAEYTKEAARSGEYSVKLIIPVGTTSGSWAIVKVTYGQTLSTLQPPSFYVKYVAARPRFVLYLDCTGDEQVDTRLLSDYLDFGSGEWTMATGGLRWGWTEWKTYGYGDVWQPYHYWQNLYGNAKVLYVALALEYWAAEPEGIGEPLYVDGVVINGTNYDLEPGEITSPTSYPTPASSTTPPTENVMTPLVPSELSELLQNLEERISKLEEAIKAGKVGVVINMWVEAGEFKVENIMQSRGLDVKTGIEEGKIEVRLSSDENIGRTILINIDNSIIPVSRVDEISVLLDGKEIPLADDYSDVLDPDEEEYLILLGAKGVQVLVSIPHFSSRTITITTLRMPSTVGIPLFCIVVIAAILLVILLPVLRGRVWRRRTGKEGRSRRV